MLFYGIFYEGFFNSVFIFCLIFIVVNYSYLIDYIFYYIGVVEVKVVLMGYILVIFFIVNVSNFGF